MCLTCSYATGAAWSRRGAANQPARFRRLRTGLQTTLFRWPRAASSSRSERAGKKAELARRAAVHMSHNSEETTYETNSSDYDVSGRNCFDDRSTIQEWREI